MAKAIMVQGTASFVGKSMLVTALCRIFHQEGIRVAPFKSQNMALNSFVTQKGEEIGYAQSVQAGACDLIPTVHMNPVLLKPDSGKGIQVIVRGKVRGHMAVSEFKGYHDEIFKIIRDSYKKLSEKYDMIVIEGAGSPAEINLMDSDLANMKIAQMADAPVLLITDIDRGGAFASLFGTLELLPQLDRDRVKGLIFNKFRGEIQHLRKGLADLERRCKKPVLGVIPYHEALFLPDEDSVGLEDKPRNITNPQGVSFYGIRIGVVHLPHISNSTDFDSLRREPQISLQFLKGDEDLSELDLLLIPGSKNPIDDLIFLWESGFAKAIKHYAQSGGEIGGICGGYQMLGQSIRDPYFVENRKEQVMGLGLLEVETVLEKDKVTVQVKVEPCSDGPWPQDFALSGYEIHSGKTRVQEGAKPLFKKIEHGGGEVTEKEGAYGKNGLIWGTYLHGLFENDSFRHWFLNEKRKKKAIPESYEKGSFSHRRNTDYESLAQLVKNHIDMNLISKLVS
ncbi:MAG TPA: cobyric acid synthase [Nitrospiria bacterium]|jgi:adenosylcobyric acid synthase